MADQGASPPRTFPTRHGLTGPQVLAMQAAGILPLPNRIELIEGELIDMGSEGDPHSNLRFRLTNAITRMTPQTITIGPDGTLRLSDESWPEPDIFVFDAALRPSQVRGPDVLLVIEVSDTTLRYDLGRKAALYARFGVREYWVVEAETGRCHIHQGPEGEGWKLVRIAESDETLSASLAPAISVRMADFL